jgi:hypothetical protein
MQNWVYKPTLKRAVEEARRDSPTSRDASPVATGRPATPSAFLPVRLVEDSAPSTGPQTRSAIEVVLSQGRRIVVGPGFDPETLRRVVAALEI